MYLRRVVEGKRKAKEEGKRSRKAKGVGYAL
jgi:hypothetical protein